MKFCSKCGTELHDEATICTRCGETLSKPSQAPKNVPKYNSIPKCNCCGHIGQWKVGPILRPIDLIIGGVLLLVFIIPGVTYLGTIALIRSNQKNREKICEKCGGRNLFTFEY